MINFKFARFTLVVYVSHKVNVLVTDIILTITSPDHLIFTSLHIGSRLFELFSKEVRVKKQPGMSLNYVQVIINFRGNTCVHLNAVVLKTPKLGAHNVMILT